MPIGFQLVGRPFDEAGLLRTAHLYEQSVGGLLGGVTPDQPRDQRTA
jgi:Asp-tRNA(Asn)/Glu-tRNA(Gln) amidotransferase A subunit family amidase